MCGHAFIVHAIACNVFWGKRYMSNTLAMHKRSECNLAGLYLKSAKGILKALRIHATH